MRVVMGLSLTANSAVWVLVDTFDGSIIADEVVPLESVNEIARAAAHSVQTFALQSERDIDGVRLVWDDDARQHGIRLRTKLRLFGFDTIETVSEDAAREGRNRTARHIAPHMVLAYGAARADADDAADRGVLRRLVARVPRRVPVGVPMHLTAAASVAALAVVGVVLYAFMGGSPASHEVPETAVAEAVIPAPPVPGPAAPLPAAPAPQAVDATPAGAVDASPMPEYSVAVPEASEDTGATDLATVTDVAGLPADASPDTSAIQGVGAILPAEASDAQTLPSGSTPSGALPSGTSVSTTGQPHLTGVGPTAGPVQAVAVPTAPSAQAVPGATAPGAGAPPAAGGPLGALFRALP